LKYDLKSSQPEYKRKPNKLFTPNQVVFNLKVQKLIFGGFVLEKGIEKSLSNLDFREKDFSENSFVLPRFREEFVSRVISVLPARSKQVFFL